MSFLSSNVSARKPVAENPELPACFLLLELLKSIVKLMGKSGFRFSCHQLAEQSLRLTKLAAIDGALRSREVETELF